MLCILLSSGGSHFLCNVAFPSCDLIFLLEQIHCDIPQELLSFTKSECLGWIETTE